MSLVLPEAHQQFQVHLHSNCYVSIIPDVLIAHFASLEHQCGWQTQNYVREFLSDVAGVIATLIFSSLSGTP